MKFLETHFEDYIKSVECYNLHPSIIKKFPKHIEQLQNTIIYGPTGIGKYSQVLYCLQKYSPTSLKYERKLNINYPKYPYNIKISDIHFEVDMSLLGCNAKILWNYIYTQILDIVSTRPQSFGVIVCKNFQDIHSELLDVFYSYMQSLSYKNIKLSYILISEHIGFIPLNIISRSIIIPCARPSKRSYEKCVKKSLKNIKLSEITNIKNLSLKIDSLTNAHASISNKIIDKINHYNELHYLEFREILYELFIYNINLPESIWYVLSYFIKSKQLSTDKACKVFIKMYPFLKYYNNNYRPIYHLEGFMLYLCKTIHGF